MTDRLLMLLAGLIFVAGLLAGALGLTETARQTCAARMHP